MNLSPKSYESVPKSTYYYLIINKLQSLIYYIFYIYYYSNKKKRAVFYFFSHYESVLCRMGGNPLVFGQIRPLEQLTNISFSGCRVRIRWGQIYNFSRMNDGFAVCFQRLIIFLLSLFFGGVTFLSVNTSGFVGEKLRICR